MQKEKILSISIFCLSLSIIISAIIIAKGLENNGNYISAGMSNMSSQLAESINAATVYKYNNDEIWQENMDIEIAASYLKLTTGDLVKLIYTEGIGFPYVKVGSNFVINKKALDKWLESARIELK